MSAPAPIRVLFLIPTLTGGGAERVVITLLKYLDRSRFQLTIGVIDTRHAVFRDEVPSDVDFIDFRCTRVRFALPKIAYSIWQRRPNVVFSTLGHLNLALAILRPLLPRNIRYIARETIHVSEGLSSCGIPKIWAWAYRNFYGVFDKVVCQSIEMRDDLVQVFQVPSKKTVVINNPIDIETVRLRATSFGVNWSHETDMGMDGCVNIVAAGRLCHQKGFDVLIRALALTSNSHIFLTLLGEGPSVEELHTMVRENRLEGRVRFLGFQVNPYPYIAQADAFVLSSRYEGFPNVVLEALALQTPVIALPSTGTREILAGLSGCVLCKDMSSQSLAVALDALLPGQRLSSHAAKSYAVREIVEAYESELSA